MESATVDFESAYSIFDSDFESSPCSSKLLASERVNPVSMQRSILYCNTRGWISATRNNPINSHQLRNLAGPMSGRGAYYKAKYGNKRNQPQSHSNYNGGYGDLQTENDGSSRGALNRQNQSHDDLVNLLHSLDSQQYNAYKRLQGHAFQFPEFSLRFLHVQGDAYAPPSALEVRISHENAQFPADLYKNPIRKIALADYLNRHFSKHLLATNTQPKDNTSSSSGWAGNKGGSFSVLTPSAYVLERSSISVTESGIEARCYLGLPARGRSILGTQCAELVGSTLPQVVQTSFSAYSPAHDLANVRKHVECVEDQDHLRALISNSKEYVAFIADGSILPRASGVSDKPLQTARPWQSPNESWHVSFDLLNSGTIKGTGIPRGITLVTGGGFHGKSTVLSALALGMVNKIPGDGREFVVVDSMTSLVQSEDGRCVHSVDVSPFINNLPLGTLDPCSFTCADASGSTSLAAHIQESREVGVRLLLMDEDTCATNFMVRDQQMHALIGSNEPITPFTARIKELKAVHGVSCILVVGSSGAYLAYADRVLGMVEYAAHDWTQRAKDLVNSPCDEEEAPSQMGVPVDRVVVSVPKVMKSRITHPTRAELTCDGGVSEWVTGPIPSLVERGQMKYLVDVLHYLAQQSDRRASLVELVAALDTASLRTIAQRFEGEHVRPRALDVVAALSRLRGMAVCQKK